MNDNDTITDEAEDSDKEDNSSNHATEKVYEQDEEDEDSDDSDFESQIGDGGYPGFQHKKKTAKRSVKASPSSVSNASTGQRIMLTWDFIAGVDLKGQSMEKAEAQIDKIMRNEMILAGNVKIVSTPDGQTRAGWKLRRV